MLFVTTLDVTGLKPEEYRAILDEMGGENRPATGIFLHLTTTDFGYRIIEIWDDKEGFEDFLEGAALAVNAEDRLDYFGQTVNIAARTSACASARDMCD